MYRDLKKLFKENLTKMNKSAITEHRALGFQSDYRLTWQVWVYQMAVLIKESCKLKGKNISRKELKQKI